MLGVGLPFVNDASWEFRGMIKEHDNYWWRHRRRSCVSAVPVWLKILTFLLDSKPDFSSEAINNMHVMCAMFPALYGQLLAFALPGAGVHVTYTSLT